MASFGGPKAKKNANLVLDSILRGEGPNSWSPFTQNRGREPISTKERKRQEKADKAWDKVIKKLGIKNYDSKADQAKVFRYVSGGGSGGSGSGGGGGSSSAVRDSGEYKEILAAQEEDRKAGEEMAEKLKELEAQVGGISPEVQSQLDSLTLANTNLTDQLTASATQYQQQLDAAAAQSAAAMQRMEMMMLQQQQQAAQTQNLLQSQLASTQSALQSQQRMSANLATAYVPQAEASAQSVTYGDARTQRRRQVDNSLSDLSIVSGVGTGTSNLAGLQLAG